MNKKLEKKGFFLLIAAGGLVLAVCAGVVLFMQKNGDKAAVPDEVSALFEAYMDAYKNGAEESAGYAYFRDEFIRSAYINSGDRLIDYQVESVEKINDNLYCFTVQSKTETGILYFGDIYRRVYNFVGRIENEWYFMNGVGNIPQAIQENLDVSKYTYTDENIVDPGDIIGEITFGEEA